MTRMAALITTGCLKRSGQLAAGRICMVNVLPKDQRAGCAALEEPEYCNPSLELNRNWRDSRRKNDMNSPWPRPSR